MSALRACPFCRTLYRPDEGSVCADCGVALVPMHTLGPSHDSQLDDPVPATLPEDEVLPWTAFGRGKGALVALCLLGLCAFFTPWVEIIRPETALRSGYDLARGRAGWLWGGAAAYFVLIPFALTRRTIARMRGVRVVSVLLASLTLCEVGLLLFLPPRGHGLVPVLIAWRWGLYASGAVSLAATLVSVRFGGSLPPLPDGFASEEVRAPVAHKHGHTLH